MEKTPIKQPESAGETIVKGLFGVLRVIARESAPDEVVHSIKKYSFREATPEIKVIKEESEEQDKVEIAKLRRQLIDLTAEERTHVPLEGITNRQVI